MAVSADYAAFVSELFAPLGPIRVRSMFGGGGVYCGTLMFALIADETLYLKADDETRAAFEAEGAGPFTYMTAAGKRGVMSYFALPERLYDEPDEARQWGAAALEAARRAALRKPGKRPVVAASAGARKARAARPGGRRGR